MSERLWKEKLLKQLTNLPLADGQPRVAVVGIGHELRGDDAAGVVVAHLLGAQPHGTALQVIEAGAAPANCSGLLLRWQPDLIVFVDAANMGEEPGTVCWIEWEEVIADARSTHHFSLRVLAEYLMSEIGCTVSLLGIQPAGTAVGAALSLPVASAVQDTAQGLTDTLSLASREIRS